MGERELRDFLATQLGAGETLLACAFGVERSTRAERLGGMLGAALGGWIGGALVGDEGWGVATTQSRFFAVKMQRVLRLLGLPRFRFGSVHAHADARGLGVQVRREQRMLWLHVALEGRPRVLSFADRAGFEDNLRQALAIGAWLEARS
jgi:hypothetical protein